MKYFSYNDYMDCMENREIYEINRVSENIAKYELQSNDENVNTIIEILKDKGELKSFLKYFLRMKDVDNLIYCDKIKTLFKKENNYLICKLSDKEIFIYIIIIGKIDNNISFKMFENSLAIIKKWIEKEKKEQKRYPIVIPVVIYIGKEKWKTNDSKNNKLKCVVCEHNRIDFSYNLIKVNEMNLEDIKMPKSRLSKELLNIKINVYK